MMRTVAFGGITVKWDGWYGKHPEDLSEYASEAVFQADICQDASMADTLQDNLTQIVATAWSWHVLKEEEAHSVRLREYLAERGILNSLRAFLIGALEDLIFQTKGKARKKSYDQNDIKMISKIVTLRIPKGGDVLYKETFSDRALNLIDLAIQGRCWQKIRRRSWVAELSGFTKQEWL